jgi:hypothetical protein
MTCLRTSSLDIFIFYFVTATYSCLFSGLLNSHINLSFAIYRFRVDTTLIWIPFLVQREGEGRFFFSWTLQLATQQTLDICIESSC